MAATKTASLKMVDVNTIRPRPGAKLGTTVVHPITTSLLGNSPKIVKVFSTKSFENCLTMPMPMDTSSDSEESCSSSTQPIRKRQRLDHLTMEEKMMRRKLKNRVAAQTARDRKKARMSYLEDQMKAIATENRKLKHQNEALKQSNASLTAENAELKQRLGLEPLKTVKEEKAEIVNETGFVKSLELAEGTGFADPCSIDDTLRFLTDDVECDDFLQVLQQFSEELEKDLSNVPETTDHQPCERRETTCPVVGTTAEGLESIREFIEFDHVYYKPAANDSFNSDLPSELKSVPTEEAFAVNNFVEEITIVSDDNKMHLSDIKSEEKSPVDVSTTVQQNHVQNSTVPVVSVSECTDDMSSAKSDSGYEDNYSLSPYSEHCLSPPTILDAWEDTFSTLFPSLVTF